MRNKQRSIGEGEKTEEVRKDKIYMKTVQVQVEHQCMTMNYVRVLLTTCVSSFIAWCPVYQWVIYERLQQGQQGFTTLLHHFKHMLTSQAENTLQRTRSWKYDQKLNFQ
jgi:hypothetical protein